MNEANLKMAEAEVIKQEAQIEVEKMRNELEAAKNKNYVQTGYIDLTSPEKKDRKIEVPELSQPEAKVELTSEAGPAEQEQEEEEKTIETPIKEIGKDLAPVEKPAVKKEKPPKKELNKN